ncbi:DUF6402 family protein [Pseudomonas sp. zfem002]|uniref:DUF6402 family protein n=1 Tax=Pseudomonas sp. zfem002 TaxID=3078197 RepID=UPI00292891FB|nr:DUF6402 family protein [Pseudomonas sp. zfem002]MDU9393382.1 DUF6402 family protein [Pseudomonas sp. zfem002]
MSLKDFQQTTALGPDALFLLEGATFDTSPGGQHRPKQIVINALPLTKLPVAMRKMGWHTSAALMQRWFDSPGWKMPESWKSDYGQPSPMVLAQAQCDEHLVKMSWAMGFERCQIAVSKAELALTTPNAIVRLKTLLQKVGWKNRGTVKLGCPTFSAREIDASSQINFVTLGTNTDTLDDMYGALGIATLKIGVAGRTFSKIAPDTQKLRNYFQVEHIGFYIRDHYDFNGPQFLGIWTANRVLSKKEMLRSSLPSGQSIYKWATDEFALIQNSDFRNYREQIGMGGDYVLYSDVLWKKVDKIIDLGEAP